MFRSEKMAFCQLILQNEVSFECMAELGELGLLQFKDLNKNKSVFKKKYIQEVKRCENLERIIRYLKHELEKNEIEVSEESTHYPAANHRVLAEYESRLEGVQKEVRGIVERLQQLSSNYVSLIQLRHLLRKTDTFFEEVDKRYDASQVLEPVPHIQVPSPSTPSTDLLIPLEEVLRGGGGGREEELHFGGNSSAATNQPAVNSFKLKFIAGVILREKLEYFERMLFRVCHGNTLLKYADVDIVMPSFLTGSGRAQQEDSSIHKAIFLVFFQGEQLQAKVHKICEGFHASIYPCPDSQSERREMSMGVMTRLEDLNLVLNQTQEHLFSILVSLSKQIPQWSVSIFKSKQIYHQLNKLHFDRNLKTLFGKCWSPVKELDRVHAALLSGASNSQSNDSSVIFHQIPTHDTPPTHNKSNSFTKVTQDIIDAYSVPAYLEVNPALYSIITFPFLFSVMFGDVGHGLLLALFGLFIVRYNFSEKLKKHEIFGMIYSGRYMILMMGIFSVYSGLLYNDCFSLPLNLLGSGWSASNISDKQLREDASVGLDPVRKDQFVASSNIFGMDPAWQLAHNKISWLNSFKMKISVIFGVSHMFFGIIISFTNHRFFSHRLDIVAGFIPQVIFILSTFGYLVLLVVYKWIAYDATQSNNAPSLLIGFINMFLMTYPSDPPSAVASPFRHGLQVVLLLLALLCVPWMLFLKPYVLYRRNGRKRPSSNRSRNHNYEELASLLPRDVEGADDNDREHLVESDDDDPSWENSTEYDVVDSEDDDEDDDDVMLDRSQLGGGRGNNTRSRNNNNNTNNKIKNNNNSTYHDRSSSTSVYSVFGADGGADDDDSRKRKIKMARSRKKKLEEFNLGEVMVTQAIHTIEFCLGCISHTASYLRLWALSLAHAQLSEVLWKMVLHYGFTAAGSSYWGSLALFVLFTPWALSTVTVLLLMEGLSAFLHTLRLHWIEFMSKFFKGEGHAFRPFSFHAHLADQALEQDQQ